MATLQRGRRTRLLVIGLVLASLFTITIDYRGGQTGPLEAAGRATLSIVGPMQNAAAHVLDPVGSFFGGLAHAGALEAENQRLRAEIGALQTKVAAADASQAQATQLEQLLHMTQQEKLTGVGALVIGSSPSNFENVITINAGSSQGVRYGMAVVAGAGLVGRVVQVAPTTSQVQLLIDPSFAVAAKLVPTGGTGLVVGNRNQDLRMQLVGPGVNVQPNQQVVTAPRPGLSYPPNILVGYVAYEYTDPASPLAKSIAVRPAVDFSSLQAVLVVGASGA